MKKLTKEAVKNNTWDLREIIHDVIRKHGTKTVACEMGIPPGRLGNEVNEYYNNAKWDAVELYRFSALMGDTAIIDAFERKLGRIAIEIEQFGQNVDEDSLFGDFSDCLCKLGKLGKEIKKARRDDSDGGEDITVKELNVIEQQAFGLIREILSILAHLEPDITNFEGK